MTTDREAGPLPSRRVPVAGLMVAIVLWMVTGIFIAEAVAQSAASADSGQAKWGWFAAIAAVNEWFVLSGVAKVTILGTAFQAELYDARDNDAAITLKGTVRDGRVEVVAVRRSTEDRPRNLAGTRKTGRWKDPPAGRETILLSERGEPGGLTIGLTRELE